MRYANAGSVVLTDVSEALNGSTLKCSDDFYGQRFQNMSISIQIFFFLVEFDFGSL
jgi:hypothetical protein